MLPRTPPSKSNQRRYPRAEVQVKALLTVGDDSQRSFQATLATRDISVGGIFFQSTFFLKIGQAVDVRLELPPEGREVRARGHVVRVETRDERGKDAGGFAIHFDEFFEASDVALANYFMSEVLRKFVEDYARRRRIKFSHTEVGAVVDVLASWELSRTLNEPHVWQAPPARRR